MKTKARKPLKTFDSVKHIREIRDKISLDTADMDYDELKEYFKQERLHKNIPKG